MSVNKAYKDALQDLNDLKFSDDHKMCFECNTVKHLDEFGVNSAKYQRPEAKGRNFCCNECVNKR